MKKYKIIITSVIGFILLVLIGIGGLSLWGYSIFKAQAKEALQNNPVVQEYIGEIEVIKLDLMATGEADGNDVFVFRIQGNEGFGVVSAEFVTIDENTEEIRSGTLRLSSGETLNLF